MDKKIDQQLKVATLAYYKKRALSVNQKNNILQKYNMVSSNIRGLLYKAGFALAGLVAFGVGFMLAAPKTFVSVVPDSALSYVPYTVKDKYVEDVNKQLQDTENITNELDSVQSQLDQLDAELSALDNL